MATTVTLKPNAIDISGSTSGTTTLQATAVAGTTTLTLPAATDTLVGKATTDTLTNKTLTTPSVSSPTISDGTANGVAYLNGSKVLTTGSALVFDGSNLGVGNASLSSTSGRVDVTINGTSSSMVSFGTGGTRKGYALHDGTDFTIATETAGLLRFLNSGGERARIPSTGGIQSVNSISVGNATPTTSGAGITFPATQSASTDANTLDDYEEGTFTVTFTCGTSGTITLDSNVNEMSYIKIGSKVTIFGRVFVGSVSSPVGSINMSLPFTSIGSLTDGADFMGLPMFTHNINLSANVISLFAEIVPGTASAIFYETFDNAAWTALPAANLIGSNTEIFYVTGSYFTAS